MSSTEVEAPANVHADNGALTTNNDLTRQHTGEEYDAKNPDFDDLVKYKGTWWRHVYGTGWVEQDSHNDRARDKGLPEGPGDTAPVKGFGDPVTVKSQSYEVIRARTVWSRGTSYGPVDDQEGVYKIDWNCVVSYWDARDKIWYNVKWDKNQEKFTKGDRAAPEGFTTSDGQTVRKWCDSNFTVKDVHPGQEFYHGNRWWVKQGRQLVEQEWNERSNQFEPKNKGVRGPSGKLVVGRFGDPFPKKNILTGVYQGSLGEIEYAGKGERSYIDEGTGVVYYYAMNSFSQMWWWYANWDEGIGKFYASWSISYGPTSENVMEWIPSTGGPYDLDRARDGQIVWYNKSFWKRIDGVWEPHAWDPSNRKFYIKQRTVPQDVLIAPCGDDTMVRVFGDAFYSLANISDRDKSGGAYMMDDGVHSGIVYWWDGRTWSVPKWSASNVFGPGIKKEKPGALDARRLGNVTRLGAVTDKQFLWYMGSVWQKNGNELVLKGGIEGMNSQNIGKCVPIGKVQIEKGRTPW